MKTEKQSMISSLQTLKNRLSQIASKNILQLTFGMQIFDKKVFVKLMDLITANFQNTSVAAAFNFIPITRIFQKSILKNVHACANFLKTLISQHADNYNPGEESNIVDAYLNELNHVSINSENLKLKTHSNSFSLEHLDSLIQDLFVAGTETIANTLSWAIFLAAHYPEFQQKCHEEIDKLIGRERAPCANNRRSMHYIEAFINETFRYHCAGPILIPRSTTVDTKLAGYKIPANTFVILNMWSCMRDEKYWNEPNKFNPDRFLNADGTFECNNPAMMPFSAGARACIGESLARSQLFIIFVSILQKFSFEFESDKVKENPNLLDGVPGITLNPPNVTFKVSVRN